MKCEICGAEARRLWLPGMCAACYAGLSPDDQDAAMAERFEPGPEPDLLKPPASAAERNMLASLAARPELALGLIFKELGIRP